MNPVGSFIKTLAGFVDGFWFALHLCPERSFNDVTDHRARVTVRPGGFAGPVVDLHDREGELATIQSWQVMGESDSRPFVILLSLRPRPALQVGGRRPWRHRRSLALGWPTFGS